MRIALFSDCFFPSVNGVSASVAAQARILEESGCEVALSVPCHPDRTASDHVSRMLGFSSVSFPLLRDNRMAFPWPFENWRRLLDFRPDIVHIHTPFAMGFYGLIYAKIKRCPVIFTHHTKFEDYTRYLRLPDFFTRFAARLLLGLYIKTAAWVIAPGHEAEESLKRDFGADNSSVMPTGIAPEIFRGGDGQKVRAEFGLAGESLLLYTGRLAYEKSADVIVKACAELLRQGFNIKLALIGKGPAEQDLKALASGLGIADRMIFAGWRRREELRDYMAAASCFVFASVTETQGLSVLEAQAAGLPVACVAGPGVSDVVIDGITGYFSRPGDHLALAASAARILSSDEAALKAMSAAASRRAEAFSEKKMAADLMAIYQSFIKR